MLLLALTPLASCTTPLRDEQAHQEGATPVAGEGFRPGAPSEPHDDQVLAQALAYRTLGEFGPMAALLQDLLAEDLDPALRRRVSFHEGEAKLLMGAAGPAAQTLATFLADSPVDEWSMRARFLLARAYEELGRHAEASAAYVVYRSFDTPLGGYAAMRQAAQEEAVGNMTESTALYEYAAAQPIAPRYRAQMLEELAQRYAEAGRRDLALARYRDLLELARRPDYRASILLAAAEQAEAAGDAEQQRAWVREILANHPSSQESLAAIRELEQSGSPAAPVETGSIYLGHEQYANAVASFDAALAGQLAEADRFEVRRLRALALRGTENWDEALAELEELATTVPASAGTGQARLDYVQTLGQSGDIQAAIEGYRRFASENPGDPLAAEALWRAVQLEARSDEGSAWSAALELGRRYRETEPAHVALQGAAAYFEANNRRADARAAWLLLGEGASGTRAAQGRFWSGATLLEDGDPEAGKRQLLGAIEAAPESYYASRARELLGVESVQQAVLGSAPNEPERRLVEDWIASWTGRTPTHVDDGWLEDVANSPEILRARELASVHLRSEAREEWFAALNQWEEEPERLWQLALLASNQNQPYVAVEAADQIVALSPAKRISPTTPVGLLRLLYPTPFTGAAQEASRQFGLDPRLLYSLVRQESRFNADATSSVGALGLTQVMPATADGIASRLGIADFQAQDLYRPALALRFGAYYLSAQMQAFDGTIQVAASAYNGGPGNAARWLEATTDPDRFTELIDYEESRNFVKFVYGNWGMYRLLYAN